MNFLLGASVVLLLLFPGLVFRLMYLNRPHNRGFSFTLVEELLFSLIPTLVIHLLCMWATRFFHFSFGRLYLVVISDAHGSSSVNMPAVYGFLGYCLTTYILAGLLGTFTQRLAMQQNWDINVPIFRIHNEWYYLLRGIFIVSPQTGRRRFASIDHIRVDAVVEIAGAGYTYTGTITDFVLSKNDGIDRVYLSDTVRRPLIPSAKSADRGKPVPAEISNEAMVELLQSLGEPESEAHVAQWQQLLQAEDAYSIPGTQFCLSFKEIRNLNITYIIEEE